ncbi:hypothetical protein CP335_19255 [Pseudomonas fluorescens]|uniref:Uncharacterized protein n=1 Tax=Pseudomonas fluorescens TaxID=294 RepID=A0A854WZ09_PSEFL|nr:hypothetical protein CP335_19255 [Pseudomonas fluorescens]
MKSRAVSTRFPLTLSPTARHIPPLFPKSRTKIFLKTKIRTSSTDPVTDSPTSRASPLPHWNAVPLWERACSRRGQPIQHYRCLTHRFREQARSHIGMRFPYGSEPAREEACTFNIIVA